ncbi:MAG TPA: hypothetical protein VFX70_21180 [Mycobacteriales bacterium]|nr:hypothetical protein [Mycobacteriales bacterium]
MDVRAVFPDALPGRIAEWLAGQYPPHPLRVAVDGAPPARPDELADAAGAALRILGRPVARVSARWFWRRASVRLEYGRHDPRARYERWLDTGALRREVLDPLGPGGDGRFLPTRWDPDRDRATREDYRSADPDTVLLLDGALLLGAGLPFDASVHIRLSPAALRRRLPPADAWMVPAFDRYETEVSPAGRADVLVLADDPAHPAIRLGPPVVSRR